MENFDYWSDFIKPKYKDSLDRLNFHNKSAIGKCFLYKKYQQMFYECDSSPQVIKMYEDSERPHCINRYDTMTSWLEFAKAFLGYGYNDGLSKIYEDYENECKVRSEKEWICERIKNAYKADNEKIYKAYEAFDKFSKYVYTIGNFIPVGYNPLPIRRNDRWDVKLKWIKETVFDKTELDEKKARKEAWEEFTKGISWKEYIKKFHLEDYVDEEDNPILPKSFPQSIDEWIDFFEEVSSKIKNRGENISGKKKER